MYEINYILCESSKYKYLYQGSAEMDHFSLRRGQFSKSIFSIPTRGGASQKYWGAHIFQKCPLYLVLSGFKTQLYLVLSGSQNLLIMAKKPWLWPSYLQNVLKIDFEIFSLLWRNFEAFYAPNMAFLSKILKKFHLRRHY